ncbi:MAG: bile acid:sodium symporter family protein [Treponema sp.]|nr:bile acid:sodium symporter family protein [Treponema sp.]
MDKFLFNLNNILGRIIPVTTPLAVALGFLFPDVFRNFRPFVPWLFGMMTFSGALKLKATELGDAVKNPLPIFLFFFTSHVIMPLFALFSSSIILDKPDVITGFVLLFAGPTAVSGFIWVAIFKGDKALGLTLILLDTLLAPLIVPATIYFLMGANIQMQGGGIALSLLFMIVIPTIIGVFINETSKGKIPKVICPVLDPLSKICLMFVIAANSTAVAHNLRFRDPVIWIVAALCIVLTVIGFLLAKLNGVIGKCGDEKSTALIISGGLRNNSAVMTIAVTFFPELTVLPTLLSIIFQQTIAAIMGKLLIRKTVSKD